MSDTIKVGLGFTTDQASSDLAQVANAAVNMGKQVKDAIGGSNNSLNDLSLTARRLASDFKSGGPSVLQQQLESLTQITNNWRDASRQARDMVRDMAAALEQSGRMADATADQLAMLAQVQDTIAGRRNINPSSPSLPLMSDAEMAAERAMQFGGSSVPGVIPQSELDRATSLWAKNSAPDIAASKEAAVAQAKAYIASLNEVYSSSMGDVKEMLARGFISPKEARVMGVEAAQAYNTGLLEKMDLAAGANINPAGMSLMANSLKDVSEKSSLASMGLGRVRYGLVALIASSTGTIPVLDRLIGAFLMMGIDSGAAIAVLAGLAAIAMAYKAITGPAEELKKKQDQLTESLRSWYEAQSGGGVEKFGNEITAVTAKITELQGVLAKGPGGEEGGASWSNFFKFLGMAASVSISTSSPFAAMKEIMKQWHDFIGDVHNQISEDTSARAAGMDQAFEDAITLDYKNRKRDTSSLTSMLTSGMAIPGARSDASKILQQDLTQLKEWEAYLTKNISPEVKSFVLAHINDLRDAIKQLNDALHANPIGDASIAVSEEMSKTTTTKVDDLTTALEKQELAWDKLRASYVLLAGPASNLVKQFDDMRKASEANQRAIIAMTPTEEEAKRQEDMMKRLASTRGTGNLVLGTQVDAMVDAGYQQTLAKLNSERPNDMASTAFEEWTKSVDALTSAYEAFLNATSKSSKQFNDPLKDEAKHEAELQQVAAQFFTFMTGSSQSFWDFFVKQAEDAFAKITARDLLGRAEKYYKDNKDNPDSLVGKIVGTVKGSKALSGAATVVGSGVAGYNVGYNLGLGTTSKTKGAIEGAIGGAAEGAEIGSAFGPIGTGIGAVVGGISGLIGGIFGAGKAAEIAAAQFKLAEAGINATIEDFKALTHAATPLDAQLADAQAQFAQMQDQIKEQLSGKKHEAERNADLAQLNALEAVRIQQIKDEYAASVKETTESLQARLLRAQGNSYEADMLDLQVKQQQEMDNAVKDGWTADQIALLAQVQAQEKLRAQLDAVTQSTLNAVQGYKLLLEYYKYEPATQPPYGQSPTPPATPPATPTQPSQPSNPSGPIGGTEVNPQADQNIIVNVQVDRKTIATAAVGGLKDLSQKQYGTTSRWREVNL